MQAFMEWFRAFWAQWGPWIAVSLIPTIITGLSVSPKTQGAATVVQKVWDIIKQILTFLSLATFKNQKGTFQLPIVGGLKVNRELKAARKMGLPPDFVVDEEKPAPRFIPPSAGAMSLLLIIALALPQMGCANWPNRDTTGGKILGGVVDCAREGLKSEIANLVPTVLAILTGGAVNWNEQLDALRTVGGDALGCAIASVGADLSDLIKPGSTASAQEQQKAAAGQVKANSYLNSRGIQTTNAGS